MERETLIKKIREKEEEINNLLYEAKKMDLDVQISEKILDRGTLTRKIPGLTKPGDTMPIKYNALDITITTKPERLK